MDKKKAGVGLGLAVAFFSLAMVTHQVIKVSQKPSYSSVPAGRSQAYQGLQDNKEYRVFENSDALARGLDDSYKSGVEEELKVPFVDASDRNAGS